MKHPRPVFWLPDLPCLVPSRSVRSSGSDEVRPRLQRRTREGFSPSSRGSPRREPPRVSRSAEKEHARQSVQVGPKHTRGPHPVKQKTDVPRERPGGAAPIRCPMTVCLPAYGSRPPPRRAGAATTTQPSPCRLRGGRSPRPAPLGFHASIEIAGREEPNGPREPGAPEGVPRGAGGIAPGGRVGRANPAPRDHTGLAEATPNDRPARDPAPAPEPDEEPRHPAEDPEGHEPASGSPRGQPPPRPIRRWTDFPPTVSVRARSP